jgi:sulfonate transport system permease protein
MLRTTWGWAGSLVGVAVVLAVWQLAVELAWVRPVVLPAPSRIAETIWLLTVSGELPTHIGVSIRRVLEGFALAAVVGLGLGLAMGLSRRLDKALDLIVQIIKPIPPIAWIPLAILWFGLGEGSKIYIIFMGGVFPILINTIDGIRQTDIRYVEVAQVLEVPRTRFVRQVVLPGALPSIMTGLRVGLSTSWICVVAAELIAARAGIGYLIMDARVLSQTDVVLAGMVTLGVAGKLADDGLRLLERRLIAWRTTYAGG